MTATGKFATKSAPDRRGTRKKNLAAAPSKTRPPAEGNRNLEYRTTKRGTVYTVKRAKVEGSGRNAAPHTRTAAPAQAGPRVRSKKYVSIRIEKDLFDQLDLRRTDHLVGQVADGVLVLRPERYLGDREVDRLTSKVMDEYAEVLKKLAE